MKQIVIEIDDEVYEGVTGDTTFRDCEREALNAIRNGTVLPEHHGRIGDLDILQKAFRQNVAGASAFDDIFNNAPTILEAKEQDE